MMDVQESNGRIDCDDDDDDDAVISVLLTADGELIQLLFV